MKFMNENVLELVKETGLYTPDVNQHIVNDFARAMVLECAALIIAHSKQLSQYGFDEKSQTALSCAGIILEHFGFKRTNNDTSN